jgi:hypothetical protein
VELLLKNEVADVGFPILGPEEFTLLVFDTEVVFVLKFPVDVLFVEGVIGKVVAEGNVEVFAVGVLFENDPMLFVLLPTPKDALVWVVLFEFEKVLT